MTNFTGHMAHPPQDMMRRGTLVLATAILLVLAQIALSTPARACIDPLLCGGGNIPPINNNNNNNNNNNGNGGPVNSVNTQAVTVTLSVQSISSPGDSYVPPVTVSPSPEAKALKAIEAILPDDLKSLAPDLMKKVRNGEITLETLELSMNLRDLLLRDDLDVVEKQTLYELFRYYADQSVSVLESLIPPDSELHKDLKNFAEGHETEHYVLIKRSFALKYFNKLAAMTNLGALQLSALCGTLYSSEERQKLCT